jgi:ParB family chromosome partitioning protein
MTRKHGGLGRGLDALIGGAGRGAAAPVAGHPDGVPESPGQEIAIDSIQAGTWQPRRAFDPEALEELAQSIRERGILQPLLVRAREGGGYDLIAGERRLRAARLAGLARVPVRILSATDREAAEMALIENLQREDLDPIEEAEGYHALGERYQMTQEQISIRVGKARATVANALRLLSLPAEIREAVRKKELSAGHAKVLLSLPSPAEQSAAARRCIREGWSVRELEARLSQATRRVTHPRAVPPATLDPHTQSLVDRMREKFGTGVQITPCRALPGGRTSKGHVAIEFYSPDDLDRLLVLLGVSDEGF